MSYCINPLCNARCNAPQSSGAHDLSSESDQQELGQPSPPASGEASHCQACGTSLLIGDETQRYRLLRPLRPLNSWSATEIFEAELITESSQPAAQSTEPIDRNDTEDATSSDAATGANAANPSEESNNSPQESPQEDHRRVLKILKQERLLPLFKQEAEALAFLAHPGIPSLDPGGFFRVDLAQLSEPMYCLVMEYIEGETLDRWLANQRAIKQKQALEWLHQLTEIVQHLHQRNLFHRDIKLSNLMRRPDGQLVLIDFGTVQPISETYLAQVSSQGEVVSSVSPGYTPPEQVNGKAVPQSDFYAMGRSLIHLLTGKHPNDFETDATGRIDWQPSAPRISKKFAQLLNDLTAPLPGQRPTTADTLLQRINNGLKPEREKTISPKVVALAILNLGLLLLHMFVFGQWHAAWQEQRPVDSSSNKPKVGQQGDVLQPLE